MPNARYSALMPAALMIGHHFSISAFCCIASASGGVIDAPGCAELRIDLDALWAYVARLPELPAGAKVTRLRKAKKPAKP